MKANKESAMSSANKAGGVSPLHPMPSNSATVLAMKGAISQLSASDMAEKMATRNTVRYQLGGFSTARSCTWASGGEKGFFMSLVVKARLVVAHVAEIEANL